MSAAPTCPDASPHVSPGDSSQSSGAIVPTAGHTDFDGETEARNNTEAAVQRIGTGGSLLSMGKQRYRGSTTRAVETPRASLSSPKTSAERLLEAVRVEGSGDGTTDSLLPPEHWIDPAMVAELVEHARTLYAARARRESSGAFLVPWATAPVLGRFAALRKRPGRVVKLVPVEEDTKGSERRKDGSIILRDETMLVDRVIACSPRLGKCLYVVFMLIFAVSLLSALVVGPALPFAILKFTNTTDVLFGPPVANSSSAASAMNISNITSDHNEPPWWVGGCVCVCVCGCG